MVNRVVTVARPYVARPLPSFVTRIAVHKSGTTTEANAELNWFDPDTGLIVYTTPQLPSYAEALKRMRNWARQRGFHFDPLVAGGYYTRRTT